ncbi:MAG: DUF6516 family protein [Gammaproteobacteria bacterium]
MAAKLIYKEKFIYGDGSIREMVLWKLPKSSQNRPHGLKYRLYYGLSDGTPVVRYDNETGKGDHRHVGERQEPYRFQDVETLVADFLADVAQARGGTP